MLKLAGQEHWIRSLGSSQQLLVHVEESQAREDPVAPKLLSRLLVEGNEELDRFRSERPRFASISGFQSFSKRSPGLDAELFDVLLLLCQDPEIDVANGCPNVVEVLVAEVADAVHIRGSTRPRLTSALLPGDEFVGAQ